MRKLLLLLLLGPSALYSQNAGYDGVVQGARDPVGGQNVAVCTQPANTNTTPCSPLVATIYSSSAGAAQANPITSASSPLSTDAFGNYHFYAAPALYTIQVYGPQIQTPFVQTDVAVGAAGPAGFSSGRPWYDVMAYGAKNDNSTDDTAAIQAAVTAACATLNPGGIIYFPPGKGYKSANTSSSVITLGCDNLQFLGTGFSTTDVSTNPPSRIVCPACTSAIITDGGTTRFGFVVRSLGIVGAGASGTTSNIGIKLGTVGDFTIERVVFDQLGGSSIKTTGGFGGVLFNNFSQNCLKATPSVDVGVYDLGNADNIAVGNFAGCLTPSIGGIGSAHRYAFIFRGGNNQIFANEGDQNEHGFQIVTNGFNRFGGNRSYQVEGNCFVIASSSNVITGNTCFDGSQTANGGFSAFKITSNSNTVSDNRVSNDGAGTGNNVLNVIDDSNSTGSTDAFGNKYSNNAFDPGVITGVLYNMTGNLTYSIQQPHRNETQTTGAGSITIQVNRNGETQFFNTALTGAVTLTLSTTGAYNGAIFTIVRGSGATGASTITACGKALAVSQFVKCEYISGSWTEIEFGSL